MEFKIYNTLNNKKEKFQPIEPNKVKMYLCGLTVYDYMHIGNARPLIMFDIFRRYLKYKGFDVRYVVNITDIDDKIIDKAIKEKKSASEIATEFSNAYFTDIDMLGIERPDLSPRATDNMNDIINAVQKLIDNGYAYEIDGDVYYRVEKFKQYGKLSGKNIDELQSGARVEVDQRKESPIDFALWKSAKPEEPYWDSPWGKGRPGWHIECSVMSTKLLSETFDIHAGGVDLIFPHHENEIAQAEGITEKPFVNYWMHNGFLKIEGEKMSKSLGNFFTVREVLKKFHPEVIRMFFLLKHYRSPINFSEERIQEAQQSLDRIYETIRNIDIALLNFECKDECSSEIIKKIKQEFFAAMDDDFNTASAVSKIFDIIKEANLLLSKENIEDDDKKSLYNIKNIITEFDSFLGILSMGKDHNLHNNNEDYLNILIDVRNKLRDKKEWQLADVIRDSLIKLNIEIEDRKDGTIFKKKFIKK